MNVSPHYAAGLLRTRCISNGRPLLLACLATILCYSLLGLVPYAALLFDLVFSTPLQLQLQHRPAGLCHTHLQVPGMQICQSYKVALFLCSPSMVPSGRSVIRAARAASS